MISNPSNSPRQQSLIENRAVLVFRQEGAFCINTVVVEVGQPLDLYCIISQRRISFCPFSEFAMAFGHFQVGIISKRSTEVGKLKPLPRNTLHFSDFGVCL